MLGLTTIQFSFAPSDLIEIIKQKVIILKFIFNFIRPTKLFSSN